MRLQNYKTQFNIKANIDKEKKISQIILLILSVAEVAVCCTVPSGSNISVVIEKSDSGDEKFRVIAPCEEPSLALLVMVAIEIIKSSYEVVLLLSFEVDRDIEIDEKTFQSSKIIVVLHDNLITVSSNMADLLEGLDDEVRRDVESDPTHLLRLCFKLRSY